MNREDEGKPFLCAHEEVYAEVTVLEEKLDMTDEEFLARYVEKHPVDAKRGRLVVDLAASVHRDGALPKEGEAIELRRCAVHFDPDTQKLYAQVLFRCSGADRDSIGSSIELDLASFAELHQEAMSRRTP